jgi:hypothetical protein
MDSKIETIAELLGAQIKGKIPEVGGGALGAARIPRVVEALQARLQPSQGQRPGRPTDTSWVRHPKIPMSAATERKLRKLAAEASTEDRRVSPMQVAAQLLEEALAHVPDE